MNLDAMDVLTARLTQARATLATIASSADSEAVPSPEVFAGAAWAVDTLLAQAQEAVAGLRPAG